MKTVLRNSYTPRIGDYCETIVVDLEKKVKYLFDCDGVFTPVSGGLTPEVEEAIAKAVGDEATLREAADQEIWTEIELIEMSSDVVDIVGTYADLESYDTSKLKNNDIIKVLADETRGGATTYYRWSTSTSSFSYVGSEGPYYTQSQVDVLLSGKQDTLIAGNNISIAADGKTISATDTTYTHFTGATSLADGTQGLVPGPLAGDENKVLKGDGTWGVVSGSNTIFYRNSSESGSTRHIYKNPDMTGAATMQDILDANEAGQVILRLSTAADPSLYSDAYLQNAYVGVNDYQMLFLDEKAYCSYDTTQPTDSVFYFSRRELQDKLTAGTNIQINGNTISATDTTYSTFTGATSSVPGAAGLVPAPAIGDDTKYLKGDGTWDTVSGGSSNTVFYGSLVAGQNKHFYNDISMTDIITTGEFKTAIDDPNTVVVIYDPDGDYQYIVVTGEGTSATVIEHAGTDVWHINGNSIDLTSTDFEIERFGIQRQLTAGSNITISSNTISATNTTYVSFVGATSSADGQSGLVPTPLIADKDKYLKGDGTWDTITIPVLYTTTGQNVDGAVTQKLFTDTVGNIESALQILNSGAGVP